MNHWNLGPSLASHIPIAGKCDVAIDRELRLTALEADIGQREALLVKPGSNLRLSIDRKPQLLCFSNCIDGEGTRFIRCQSCEVQISPR